MIQPSILSTENITPPCENEEEYEYVRKVERVTLFNKTAIDQYNMAYNVFKSAKLVNIMSSHKIGTTGYIYEVQVTYPSCEEQEYDYAYGDDYNDFND